jgi:hypothetical protein
MSVENRIQELLMQSKVLSEEVKKTEEEVITEAEKGGDQTDNKKAVDGTGAVNGKQTATHKSSLKTASPSAKGDAAAGEGSHIANIKSDGVTKVAEEKECDDEDEDDEDKVVKMKEGKYKMKKEQRDITVDVSEDVAALTSDETLSEEFKTKAATIFEAAVVARVKQELAKIEEEFDTQFETQLQEEVEKIAEGMIEKVDGYLDYVVEQWMKENEIALESGIKSEITENFIGGLKTLFEEHYIEIPEEKFDVIGELEAKAADAEEKLNEALASAIELKKQLDEAKKTEVVRELQAGLTETEVEKFQSLASEIVFESAESYKEKLATIRESYFKSAKVEVKGGVEDEGTAVEQKVMTESIARYAEVLGKSIKK